MTSTNLSFCAMLVNFTISRWRARKTDRKVNEEVAIIHNTTAAVGNYRKSLLPVDAVSYEAIATAEGAARTFHYVNTLPWLDSGARILPAANFDAYSLGMRRLRDDFDDAVRAFLVEYPTLRESARQYLNGMYNPTDYPDTVQMVNLFAFETSFYPMPDAADFRVNLSAETLASIRANVEESSKTALRDAMKDVNNRLLDALAAMRNRLAEPKSIFRDTLFTNLAELVEIMPRLNLTNDPDLTARCEEIKAGVLACSPDTARKDPRERARVAAEVARIASLMS